MITGPRIYIYDRPLPEDHFVWRQRDLMADNKRLKNATTSAGRRWPVYPDLIYQAGDAFLQRLLRDPTHRTTSSAEADLFLLPLERVFIQNTYDLRVSHLIQHWIESWLIGQGRAQGPLHKHVWLISTDQCAAGSSRLAFLAFKRWFQRYGGVVLCHYAVAEGLAPLLQGAYRRNHSVVLMPGSPLRGGLRAPSSDDGPWLQPALVAQAQRAYGPSSAPPPRRRNKLLFWGGVRLHRAPPETRACLRRPSIATSACGFLYSRGVRQVMWSLFANHSFADFRSEEPSFAKTLAKQEQQRLRQQRQEQHHVSNGDAVASFETNPSSDAMPQDYYEALLRTDYCLVATGNGFGVRLIDYMASGCIPVIINNSVWYPYEQPTGAAALLQPGGYDTFAHLFTLDAAHTVVDRLRAESDSERSRRRKSMKRHFRKFIWDEEHGQAYQTTLQALARAAAKSQ